MTQFPFVNSTRFPIGDFPLQVAPYYSRISDNVVSEQKNYNYIAYKPGYALQASELNEFMDLLQFNMTMTNYMMSNWGGPHIMLNPRNRRSSEVQCIGENAQGGPGGLPGFIGSCPVDPKTVDVSHLDDVWTITINPGWYYVVGKEYRLGVFTYLEESKSIQVPSNWSSSLTEKVGVKLKHTYVSANGDVEAGLGDTSLYDNSGGFVDENAPGADRIKIEIESLKYFGSVAGSVPTTDEYACVSEANAGTNYQGNPCRCFSQMFYLANNQVGTSRTVHFANGIFVKSASDAGLLGATDDYFTCTQFSPWACD